MQHVFLIVDPLNDGSVVVMCWSHNPCMQVRPTEVTLDTRVSPKSRSSFSKPFQQNLFTPCAASNSPLSKTISLKHWHIDGLLCNPSAVPDSPPQKLFKIRRAGTATKSVLNCSVNRGTKTCTSCSQILSKVCPYKTTLTTPTSILKTGTTRKR